MVLFTGLKRREDDQGGIRRGKAYNLCLVVGRVPPQRIRRNLNRCANNHDDEEPRPVADDGEVEYPGEHDTVEDRADDGEGKGRVVWPDDGLVGSHYCCKPGSSLKRKGDLLMFAFFWFVCE